MNLWTFFSAVWNLRWNGLSLSAAPGSCREGLSASRDAKNHLRWNGLSLSAAPGSCREGLSASRDAKNHLRWNGLSLSAAPGSCREGQSVSRDAKNHLRWNGLSLSAAPGSCREGLSASRDAKNHLSLAMLIQDEHSFTVKWAIRQSEKEIFSQNQSLRWISVKKHFPGMKLINSWWFGWNWLVWFGLLGFMAYQPL